MLNIIICIKQVPNTDKVRFDWKRGSIVRKNIESIMNPDDLHAIELGLRLKEKFKGKITVITMGPPQAEAVLREAYAMGVDKCILISDKRFAGSDTLITSKVLQKAISKIGNFDMILTGFETIDGNTGQVSYQLAEMMEIPHLTQVNNVEIKDKIAIIKRLYGHEYQKVKVTLPVLIAASKETNTVRHPRLKDIKECFEKEIETITLEDIGGTEEDYGLKASPTITLEGEIFKHKRKREVFSGTTDEKIDSLIKKLMKYGILKH